MNAERSGGGGGRRAVAWALAALAAVAASPRADGFQSLRSDLRMNGSGVMVAFEPVREVLQSSSAVIYEGRRVVVYGAVVAAGGLIVTKASEIDGRKGLSVRVGERRFERVEVLGVDEAWDLALLKVEADDLMPVRWSEAGEPPKGTWVVTNGATSRTRRRALAGIISAEAREIPATGGPALGVVLDADAGGMKIAEVLPQSGAAMAGLEPGDRIVTVDGAPVADRAALMRLLDGRKAGDKMKIGYLRGDVEAEVEVELSSRSQLFGDPMSRNDQMSGRFSERRSGFPRVLQHDIPGARDSVGGPLLILDGEGVGLNIARANRAENFAIPAKELLEAVARLRRSSDR